MKKIVFALLYTLIGIIIASTDWRAGVLYATVLPLNYVLFRQAMKTRILVYTVFMLLVFVGMGIDPVFFFLRKERVIEYNIVVGDYKFVLDDYFWAYSFFFVYTISVMWFMRVMTPRKNKGYIVNFISTEMRKIASNGNYIKNAETYIYIVSFLGILLSIWMYVNTIGMIGLKNHVVLPFHLNGVLVYFRKGFLTLLLLYLYIKAEHKKGPLICLLIYAPIVGITASSRLLAALLLGPIGVMELYKNKKIKGFAIVFFAFITYGLITASRVFTFASTTVEIPFSELMQLTWVEFQQSSSWEDLFYSIAEITDRLGGCRMIIISNQFDLTSISELLLVYMGVPVESFIDVAGDIMGMKNTNSDFAFGTGLQLTGTVQLLANHNYFFAILQGLLTALILVGIDKVCCALIRRNCMAYLKLLVILLSLYVMYMLWAAQFKSVIIFLIGVIILNLLFKVKKVHYCKNC